MDETKQDMNGKPYFHPVLRTLLGVMILSLFAVDMFWSLAISVLSINQTVIVIFICTNLLCLIASAYLFFNRWEISSFLLAFIPVPLSFGVVFALSALLQ
jgi:uncharacterized membrane protein